MTPKMVDREQKRLQIIGSAFNVLRDKGYMDTKMSDIAEAVGIGKGTLYEYFANKEELVAATVETMIRLSQDSIYRELDAIADPEEKLRRFIRLLAEAFGEESGLFRLFIEIVRGSGGGGGRFERMDYLAEAYKRTTNKVEAILKEGIDKGVFRKVDVPSTAVLLVCIMDGLQLPYGLDRKSVDVKKVNGVVEEMVFSYLK
ncbi:MAG: TetR/AcrR family transcriptional regulator [Actinobacteria bacterium]|jgi:TetR/AcrR family fatty acid metabolism transcriptional regulator|nr:MAG: TetR/AcrR family transcriptional regulator [Actinomycetota bacterium]